MICSNKNVENRVKSFTDNSLEYIVNLDELSCTCKDWTVERFNYSKDDPRRLCKHIIQKIDICTLSNELKYFAGSIKYCKENKYSFSKDFEEIIYIENADCKVLYKDSGWINIYDVNGFEYGLMINGSNFTWTNTKEKPLNYTEIEKFFYNNDLLEAVELSNEEKLFITHLLISEGYKNVELEINYEFERCANSLIYDVVYDDNNETYLGNYVEITNEVFKFSNTYNEGFCTYKIFRRNQGYVCQSKIKRQKEIEEKEKILLFQEEQCRLYNETESIRTLFSKYNISHITSNELSEIIKLNYVSDNYVIESKEKYCKLVFDKIRFYDKYFLEFLNNLKDKIEDYRVYKIEEKKKKKSYRQELLNNKLPNVIKTEEKYLHTDKILKLCEAPFDSRTFNRILKELNFIEKVEYKINRFSEWVLINDGLQYGDNIIYSSNEYPLSLSYVDVENIKPLKWLEHNLDNDAYILHTEYIVRTNKISFPHTYINWKTDKFLDLYKQVRAIYDSEPNNKKGKVIKKNPNPKCHYCECSSTHKKGKRQRDGYEVQRYQCSECKKIFQEKIE